MCAPLPAAAVERIAAQLSEGKTTWACRMRHQQQQSHAAVLCGCKARPGSSFASLTCAPPALDAAALAAQLIRLHAAAAEARCAHKDWRK